MPKTVLISVRVTPEISKSLNEVAEKHNISKSMLIRNMMTKCQTFYKFLETEKIMRNPDYIKLEGEISEWIIENFPDSMTPELMRFVGGVMGKAADALAQANK